LSEPFVKDAYGAKPLRVQRYDVGLETFGLSEMREVLVVLICGFELKRRRCLS
jgi:hypothetical protein